MCHIQLTIDSVSVAPRSWKSRSSVWAVTKLPTQRAIDTTLDTVATGDSIIFGMARKPIFVVKSTVDFGNSQKMQIMKRRQLTGSFEFSQSSLAILTNRSHAEWSTVRSIGMSCIVFQYLLGMPNRRTELAWKVPSTNGLGMCIFSRERLSRLERIARSK